MTNNYSELRRENERLREHYARAMAWLIALFAIGGLGVLVFVAMTF